MIAEGSAIESRGKEGVQQLGQARTEATPEKLGIQLSVRDPS
jgi:hypothetical protein